MQYGIQNCPIEWAYRSGMAYDDPFNEITLDVVVTDPAGEQHVVPAYWAGDQTWRVRYASPLVGLHRHVTVCSDAGNESLHGQDSRIEVTPYTGSNPLYRHGPLRVSVDQRYMEHLDGTPFFWLGDTWWMSLCRRLRWPDEFRILQLEPGVHYQAFFYNPINGHEHLRGAVTADADGSWPISPPPAFQDWILVLERPTED